MFSGWARLLLLTLLLLNSFRHLSFVNAAFRAPTRHPIKINPGPTAAVPTPTIPSHTFSMPDPPATSPAYQPRNQAQALRQSKSPGQIQLNLPPRPPANFSLPPLLLDEWRSKGSAEGGGEVDVRFDEMYEEALWRRWDGECMHARQDGYHYTLCPFRNITQRGLQLTSLHVVLGSADIPRYSSHHHADFTVIQLALSLNHSRLCCVCLPVVAVCGLAGGRHRLISWR